MSADTPEGRAAEMALAIESVEAVLDRYLRITPALRRIIAEDIYRSEPERCDFDCDRCRE